MKQWDQLLTLMQQLDMFESKKSTNNTLASLISPFEKKFIGNFYKKMPNFGHVKTLFLYISPTVVFPEIFGIPFPFQNTTFWGPRWCDVAIIIWADIWTVRLRPPQNPLASTQEPFEPNAQQPRKETPIL